MKKRSVNNYYIVCCFLALFLFSSAIYAQDPKQVVRLIESNRDEYYFGHGYADSYDDAVTQSKSHLVNDISTYVSSQTFGTISNSGVSMEERISTYSNMVQLREVTTILVDETPMYHTFSYITKETVYRMYEERKSSAFDYLEEGLKAERKLHISDALQNYYWSLLIIRTLPDADNVSWTDGDGVNQKLLPWLNKRIRSIVDDVKFEIKGVTGDDAWHRLDVAVSYHDRPVVNCDYRYWTGLGYSQMVRAKNGHGVAEFKEVPDKITFYVEYVFENEAQNIDPVLRDIMQKTCKPSFKNSHTVAVDKHYKTPDNNVEVHPAPEKQSEDNALKVAKKNEENHSFFTALSQTKNDSCQTIMKAVKNAVRSRNYTSVQHLFTEEGWKMFYQMFNAGKSSIAREAEMTFLQTSNEIVCRSLPMSFYYPRSGKTIVENVEFCLNTADLKIHSVAFTLNSEAESDILDTNKSWNDYSRYQLIHFLQNYQTAYALKRLDYLNDIFSEDALIIVGTKVKKAPKMENQIVCSNSEQYELTTKTKAEYMAKLAQVFNSQEFVNLQFKDNDVIRAGNGQEVYGIQIRQQYSSSSYADQGYLFLVVDLRNPDKPIIHVRAWQAEKNPDFGLFDLGMFTF